MTRYNNFHAALATPYDSERMVMTVYKLDRTGGINTSQSIARYDELLLQSSQEQDSEKVQIALASDAAKLYAFGAQHKFYIYQAELLDTELEKSVSVRDRKNITSWTGKGYNMWQDFYEIGRLHSCAKNRYVVELTYLTRRMYGAIIQMSASTDSGQPHKYSVTFSFLATHVVDEPFQEPDLTDV